eukprot:gene46324-biopygen63498
MHFTDVSVCRCWPSTDDTSSVAPWLVAVVAAAPVFGEELGYRSSHYTAALAAAALLLLAAVAIVGAMMRRRSQPGLESARFKGSRCPPHEWEVPPTLPMGHTTSHGGQYAELPPSCGSQSSGSQPTSPFHNGANENTRSPLQDRSSQGPGRDACTKLPQNKPLPKKKPSVVFGEI